jgi:hypothetical protein
MALNPQNLQVGRHEKNRAKKYALDWIGEDNFNSLIQMQWETANNCEDKDMRDAAQKFLIKEVMSKMRVDGVYVKFDLKDMATMKDIKDNEDNVMKNVSIGNMSLEQGERLLAMTKQAQDTFQATVMMKMFEDLDGRLAVVEENKLHTNKNNS